MEVAAIPDVHESSIRSGPRPEPASDEVSVAAERVQLIVTVCDPYRGADVIHPESVRGRFREAGWLLFGHGFFGEDRRDAPGTGRPRPSVRFRHHRWVVRLSRAAIMVSARPAQSPRPKPNTATTSIHRYAAAIPA